MGQLLIRNLDDAVVLRLKAKAKAAGKSLEQYLRDLLTEETVASQRDLLRQAALIRAVSKSSSILPEDLTRQDRDHGHSEDIL